MGVASTASTATTATVIAPPVPSSAPSLQECIERSTDNWQNDLSSLFSEAKDRFPDVVWEVGEDEEKVEEVWGHKAIVYARAPPSFQSRYFIKPPGSRTPSPSPFRASPAPSTTPSTVSTTQLLRIHASITPALFANELEYLYTGQGFGEAFEFLFDSSQGQGLIEEDEDDIDGEQLRIDKLRKDLVFMWRSRLYSDIRIALQDTSANGNHKEQAVFSTHKFILVSRSFYFRNILYNSPAPPPNNTITLPSPPFTPASLHFTLGYLYTGTLSFSHRTYDLSTAFAIFLSARHLHLHQLEHEIRARIIMEMAHGLFHAFLTFSEYERVTGGVWGTPSSSSASTTTHTASNRGGSGCRCKPCSRRAPRILQFALSLPQSNPDPFLDRGARRALVGLYGEGWVTQEYASLSPRVRESIGRGVRKRVWGVEAPEDKDRKKEKKKKANGNVFRILWAGESALNGKLAQKKGANHRKTLTFTDNQDDNGNEDDIVGVGGPDRPPYLEIVRADLIKGREACDEYLAERCEEAFRVPREIRRILRQGREKLPLDEDVDMEDPEENSDEEEDVAQEWYDILMRGSVVAPSLNANPNLSISSYPSITTNSFTTTTTTLTLSNSNSSQQATDQLYVDSLHLTQILSSVMRGLKEENAGRVYQVLVANVLLLPNPYGDGEGALLSETSHVRVQVEQTRLEILSWIKKRWRGVQEAGGFLLVGEEWVVNVKDKDGVKEEVKEGKMEGWAVKEIADYIEIPVEDLLQHPSSGTTGTSTPTSFHPHPHPFSGSASGTGSIRSRSNTPTQQRLRVKNADSDMLSVNSGISGMSGISGVSGVSTMNSGMTPSMRVAVMARKKAKAKEQQQQLASQSGSGRVKNLATSFSATTTASQTSLRSTASTQRRREKAIPVGLGNDRPDSKLTPVGGVSLPEVVIEKDDDDDNIVEEESGEGDDEKTAEDPDEDVEMRSPSGSPSPSPSLTAKAKGGKTPTSTNTPTSTRPPSLRTKISGPPAGSSRASLASVSSSISPRQHRLGVGSPPSTRPSSSVSTRSTTTTTTLRRGSNGSNTPGVTLTPPRPVSTTSSTTSTTTSTTSDGSTTFKTAPSTAGGGGGAVRKRTVSSTSVGSVRSTTSVTSTNTVGGGKTTRKASGSGSSGPTTRATSPSVMKRPISIRSVSSNVSRVSRKVSGDKEKVPPLPSTDEKEKTLKKKGSGDTITGSTTPRKSIVGGSGSVTRPTASSAAKSAAAAVVAERRASRLAAAAAKNPKSTMGGKKNQNNTFVVSPTPNVPPHLKGATLEIGIPCIVSSKKKRFRAFARYIGEVEGEVGPWVGVEVPITEGTMDREMMMMSPIPGQQGGSGNSSLSSSWNGEGRQWNDGSWGGIRYFEIAGSGGSEWGDGIGGGVGGFYGEDSRVGRRRFGTVSSRKRGGEPSGDSYGYGSTIGRGTKRMRIRSASPSTSETSGGGVESRGLFVRPQQVLYVVDAIDEDL